MLKRSSLEAGGVVALASLLGIALAGGVGDAVGAARRAADRELLILTTTSNRGELDPCG